MKPFGRSAGKRRRAAAPAEPAGAPPSMAWVPGGTLRMGSERFYVEEAPIHDVPVDGLWVDRGPVTVAAFARFVEETGYVTLAERAPDAADYPGADPALLVPGSLVFRPPPGAVDLRGDHAWWAWTPGACWRHPEGPDSDVAARAEHPVTHVAYEDAAAYAAWAGKALPTEPEWEWAARGGLRQKTFPWGDEPEPGGAPMANTWQGDFPDENLELDGYAGTSPVGTYPANGYGLHDVVGNVWEWTASAWTRSHAERAACCGPAGHGPDAHIPRHVIKGGSHLCAPSYCLRYRPAARQGQPIDTATGHVGFRCVLRP